MKSYQRIAETVAADIRTGRLKPGDQLPVQRDFARQHGIANSTAGRVYHELARLGLTVGEVGRGTFVRGAAPARPRAETTGRWIDLELNYPIVPELDLLAAGLDELACPAGLQAVDAAGTPAAREIAAELLARGGWQPDPARVLFAGNGRQAISAVMTALTPPGARLGVEELTYPALKAIAARLGVVLVPLPMDDRGLLPEAVADAHRDSPLHSVYVQPIMLNPLSLTMSGDRMAELAEVLRQCGIFAIEDSTWAFLRDDVSPFAAHAPERTILIDSLSKRIAPGLTLGFAVTPSTMIRNVATSVNSGGLAPMRFALEAASAWQTGGVVRTLVRAKQREAAARQELVRKHLGDFEIRTDPRSYFCWWDLPRPWRADTFVAAAARHDIGVAPAAAFAVGPRPAPDSIRLGLGSVPADVLASALATLGELARSTPDDRVTSY